MVFPIGTSTQLISPTRIVMHLPEQFSLQRGTNYQPIRTIRITNLLQIILSQPFQDLNLSLNQVQTETSFLCIL